MAGAKLRDRQCRRDVRPAADGEIDTWLAELHGDWSLGDERGSLSRRFRFGNYYETIAFVNALAWIAHAQDHHPDLEVGYNRCLVVFRTHSVGGLSENDFISAARVDQLTATT